MTDEAGDTGEVVAASAIDDIDYAQLFAAAIEATQARASSAAGDEAASNDANWESLGELTDVLNQWASDDGWWERAEARLMGEAFDEGEVWALLTEDIDVFLESEYEDLVSNAGLSPVLAMLLTSQLRTALDAPGNVDTGDPSETLSSARATIRLAVRQSRELLENRPESPSGWSKVWNGVDRSVRGVGGGATIAANVTTSALPFVAVVASGLGGAALIFDAFRRRS